MKKRTLSLLLALVLVIGLLPVTAQARELDNGLLYEVYEDHVEITGYTGEPTEVVIPAEIEGLPVTVIGNGAFSWCTSLTSLDIPASVTSIGENAFSSCNSLTSISFSTGLTSIGYGAFSNCFNLINAAIPEGVTSIGNYAFDSCHNLTSVSIPASVTSIGISVFSSCYSLTGIHVSEQNTVYSSDERGVLFDKEKTQLIQAPCAIAGSYNIPDGVTTVYSESFRSCSALSSISIPGSVTLIGDLAFYANSVNSITFLGDAPRFAESAFAHVTAIAHYPAGNPTWTADVMQNYEGTILWYDSAHTYPFNDVPAGSFYEIPALWAQERGITNGTSPTEFSPYDSCLRSQVVTFLWRAAGEPKAESTVNPFVDVKPTDYYYDAVLWAVEQGITTGADATHFEPNGVCNRAQVVTFLWRANGSPQVSVMIEFTDVESGYYLMAVGWATEEGITNGISDTLFGPYEPCSRSQVVTFLFRACN